MSAVLRFAFGLLISFGFVAPIHAQDYPNRTITVVIPFPPGGPPDAVGRATAAALQKAFGKSVIVENKTGASGLIGIRSVMNARPDGYTLLIGSPVLVIAPATGYTGIDFDAGLAPVGLIAASPQAIVVSPALGVTTLNQLVDLAKQKSRSVSFASGGNGTSNHLSAELLNLAAGIEMMHVPYRGTGQAIVDVISGQVSTSFADVASSLPLVSDGKLRALAVTGTQRSELMPDVPTTAEAGFPTVIWQNFQALLAPVGTPTAIIDTVSKALEGSKADPQFLEVIKKLGGVPAPSSPKQLQDFLVHERQVFTPVVKRLGLTFEP